MPLSRQWALTVCGGMKSINLLSAVTEPKKKETHWHPGPPFPPLKRLTGVIVSRSADVVRPPSASSVPAAFTCRHLNTTLDDQPPLSRPHDNV
ncbi:hypothetical protein BaRGS_00005849 [Batillaria attramentaria]|uniref:Uncharacterized protein n=1 Tax=Batillaria attramentaria TaxID=370345 RepID=A0ABD0LTN8_9CAEN